jgi:hypothetical protein
VASIPGLLVTILLLTTMSVLVTVSPPCNDVMKYVNVEYSVFVTSGKFRVLVGCMANPSLSSLGGSVTGHSLLPLYLSFSVYSPSKQGYR